MKLRYALRQILLWLLLCGSMASAGAAAPDRTKKILIVGDSWAMSITKENVDGFPSADVFDDVLAANGLGAYATEGATTAWGGRRASDWAKPAMLDRIQAALAASPSIDYVHLIVGGNDFLGAVETAGFRTKSGVERGEVWAGILSDVEKIVVRCLSVRPGIRVVVAGYDYLDFDAAAAFWKRDFHGVDSATLNGWLVEFSRAQCEYTKSEPRCTYVQNFGTLQYWFGTPPRAVPLPGQAPGYVPFPGGDSAQPMPAGVSPDGIHPGAAAHARLLQNAVDQCYGPWLRAGDSPPDSVPGPP